VNDALAGYDSRPELHALLHPDLKWWHPLSQAQHIEARTFLTPYLLSTQGDRMAMAHSVEGRFPFLDHRLVEFAGTIPPRLRMRGLHEKRILRKAIGDLLPEEIRQRAKQPYRAPIGDVFCSADAPEYVGHLLSPETVQRDGYFNPAAVQHLLAKGRSSPALSESDSMALVGILSTQLWHTQFVTSFRGDSIRERMDVIDVSGSHATGWRPPQQSNRAS
jgi:asparagine synthase (glutamine-hydrolysing)